MDTRTFSLIRPVLIVDWLLEAGAAVSYEVPLDRAGRDVADVVAFLKDAVYVVEVKPDLASYQAFDQIERYVRAAMKRWRQEQVYGFLVAARFSPGIYPRGHVFLQRWPL